MQKPDQRLMFWVDGQLLSKFLFEIVPQPGQIWNVPLGSDNLDTSKDGRATVKVLMVEISASSDLIDINVKAEYSSPISTLPDKQQETDIKPRSTWSEHQPLER